MIEQSTRKEVSICLVTYNHEKYIQECIESIIQQKCNFNFEIVIGEDCSTDNTKSIIEEYVKEYPHIIKLLSYENNVGAQINFANIIKNCSGKYIVYIDGDDRMLNYKLQVQRDFLEKNNNCAMVAHKMRVFNSDNNKTIRIFSDTYTDHLATIDDLIKYGVFFCNSSVMVRASAIPVDGVDLNTKFVGDFLFHIENAVKGDIGFISKVFGEYRIHGEGQSTFNALKTEAVLKDYIYTLTKLKKFNIKKKTLDYGFARIYYERSVRFLEVKNYKRFNELIDLSYEDKILVKQEHKYLYKLRGLPRLLYYMTKLYWFFRN